MIKLTLPFPDPCLSPNSRLHWAKKQKAKKLQRDAGFYAAYPYRGKINAGTLHMRLIFYPPSNRRMDLDNALARLKQGVDGVCLGLGIDDSQFSTISIGFGDSDKYNPRVEINIEQ